MTRALDKNHDWLFGKGQNDYLTGVAEVQQNVDTRLLSFLGDCFFDIGTGIDWFHLLGGKNLGLIDTAVRTTILNTDNVIGLTALTFKIDVNRGLTAIYDANSIYGVVNGAASVDASIAQ